MLNREIVNSLPKVDFRFDVDGVEVDNNSLVASHVGLYQDLLPDLTIIPEELAGLERGNYRKTFDLPSIAQYRQQHPEQFETARAVIRTHSKMHLNFATEPNSTQGVWRLLVAGNHAGTYTVRPPEIESETRQWLATNFYPDHQRVTICNDHEDKIRRILTDAEREASTSGDCRLQVLIDDSLGGLLKAAQKIATEEPALVCDLYHLVIVGYGYTPEAAAAEVAKISESGEVPVQVLSLPDWNTPSVDNLITELSSRQPLS